MDDGFSNLPKPIIHHINECNTLKKIKFHTENLKSLMSWISCVRLREVETKAQNF